MTIDSLRTVGLNIRLVESYKIPVDVGDLLVRRAEKTDTIVVVNYL